MAVLSANILSVKDNAKSTLSAGISAVSTSLVLQAGEGALFPQPYNGTASSLGSSTTLNCTGIQATIGSQVGKPIFNATDGSMAFIKSISTNSLTTTPLLGGSDNTFQSGDAWRIDEFVITALDITTNAYGVETANPNTREQMLIIGRSTDTLTVATGGRGYNGTVATTWDSGDHIRLLVSSPNQQRIVDYLSKLAEQVETNGTNITTNAATGATAVSNIRSGSDFYAVATGSSSAYAGTYGNLPSVAAGLVVAFKANHTCSGASTFNYNSGGAVAIKKLDGATALASGDIQSGQVVVVEYDGTNWQMISPGGNNSVKFETRYIARADSAAVGASSTAENEINTSYTVTGGDWAVGAVYKLSAAFTWGIANTGGSDSLTIRVKLGSTAVITFGATARGATNLSNANLEAYLVCRSTGASGTVYSHGYLIGQTDNLTRGLVNNSPDTFDLTASQAIKVSAQFSTSSGSHTFKSVSFIVTKLNP